MSAKKAVTWAYFDEESDGWAPVDKSVLEGASLDGIEKAIGFEGKPDPATGFYCIYDGGRLKNE